MAPPRPAATRPADQDEDADDRLRRSQLHHDIRHELATIIMLASVVGTADDVGPMSRLRINQLLGEARWLDRLLQADRDVEDGGPNLHEAPPERIQVDTVARSVVSALRLSTATPIMLTAVEAWAHADQLALWRAVRNVVENAVRIAGPRGDVRVCVRTEGQWTVTQVDDDGPGFGAGSRGTASLGLGIVRDFVAAYGGTVQFHRSELGGGCVRILLAASAPPTAGAGWARRGGSGDAATAV